MFLPHWNSVLPDLGFCRPDSVARLLNAKGPGRRVLASLAQRLDRILPCRQSEGEVWGKTGEHRLSRFHFVLRFVFLNVNEQDPSPREADIG